MNRKLDVAKLISYARTLDLKNAKLPEEYFYASLPLCVIDAVFSIGVNYHKHTKPTVRRWCDYQNWQMIRPPKENRTIDNFLSILAKNDSAMLAKEIFKNSQRTSSRNGILKAEAVRLFAKELSNYGIQTFDDLKKAIVNQELEDSIRNIPGQRSGISYKYFLMLAGSDSLIKADRMICRFVAQSQGLKEKDVKPEQAESLVISACNILNKEFPNLSPRLLDYAIWNYQRTINVS